jgi:hypothetical protein
MAVDLNQNVDEDILDSYTWSWLDMGDDKVCPDCEALAKLPPASFTEWETKRTLPARGDTVCGDHCRCVLFPEGMIRTSPDLLSGEKIVIKDVGDLVVSLDVSYELFSYYDDLIALYHRATGGERLPDDLYRIPSVDGRIEFLKKWLRENEG